MNERSHRDNDQTFQRLLADCLENLERGELIDREQLRREHPEHADLVCDFLDNNERVIRAIGGLRGSDENPVVDSAFAPTLDTQSPDRSTKFEIGDSLRYVGEYAIVDEIARGGMGIVFRARQSQLGRDVALKMILAGRLASQADVDRFYREARAAAALKHPSIVGVHEVGEHDGHHYFTMDLVQGRSLARVVSEGALSPKEAAHLIRTIAVAIQYAHEHGVLHRDLKPANILIDAEGQPHITDFGLAKTLVDDATNVDLTATGQILGTPTYMSPEQASAKHQLVSVASDVYSLGAVLYACLTGRGPFVADSTIDTIRQVIEKDPVSIRLLNPQIPKDLETICLKCLQKEPRRRYDTAAELAADLKRFIEGRPVVARPVPITTKAFRWTQRNLWVATMAALSVSFLLTGTFVSTYFAVLANQKARDESEARTRADLESKSARESRDLMQNSLKKEMQAKIKAEKSLLTSRWNVYKMSLFPMLKAWEDENFGLLRASLTASVPAAGEPDFRNWEWYLFHNAVAQRTIARTDRGPYGLVEYDCTGRLLAGRREDGTIDILDAVSLEVLHSLPGARQLYFAWHPSRSWLAAADAVNALNVWHVESEELLRQFKTEDDSTTMTTRGVAWNSQGTTIALGGRQRIDLFDLQSGNSKRLKYSYWGRVIDWTPDDDTIAVGGVSSVCAIDVEANERRWRSYRGNTSVYDLAWNEDGTTLAAAWQYPDYCVRLYDTDGTVIHKLDDGQGIHALNWLDDRKTLVSAGNDHRVHFWDTVAGKHLRSLAVANDMIESMDVDPSSGHAVLASADGVLQIVPLADQSLFEREIKVSTGPTSIDQLQWHPNESNLLAVGSSSVVHVVDVAAGEILQSFAGLSRVCTLDWHPSQRELTLLENSGRIVHYDVDSGEELEVWRAGTAVDGVTLQWSPDGRRILVGTGQKRMGTESFSVEVFDPDTKSDRVFLGEYSPRSVACWSPNSKFIAVRSWRTEKTIQVWDVETQTIESQSEPFEGFLEQIDYSSDSERVAFGGNGGAMVVYDTVSDQVVVNQNADSGIIRSVRWSPDGSRLLTCAENGTLRLWDSQTLELTLTLDQQMGIAADWSSDGRRIATCSADGLLRIWDSGPRD